MGSAETCDKARIEFLKQIGIVVRIANISDSNFHTVQLLAITPTPTRSG